MEATITPQQLVKIGLDRSAAQTLAEQINTELKIGITAEETWDSLSKKLSGYPFAVQLLIFESLFPNWHEHPEFAPAVLPSVDRIANANISHFMSTLQCADVRTFHQWTKQNRETFWQAIIAKLGIIFDQPFTAICDLSQGSKHPRWLPQAKLNIARSCLSANPQHTALIYYDQQKQLRKFTYGELDALSNRIANSLVAQGFKPGDVIGIAMPMNHYAIAFYLGVIKMGGVVASIADSFSQHEIATRLSIAKAKAIFTQDFNIWGGKKLAIYDKIRDLEIKAIVLALDESACSTLAPKDIHFADFLLKDTNFNPVSCEPNAVINILFSSGTTAEPKAIPWDHTSGIKAASDAYFHQDIHAQDVLAWPTNLGWMMGPWLIFAALINHATIAVYTDAPKDRAFGEFIANAKVTMLGVVPTLVATWRQSACMEGLDWRALKLFSSTGECSNPEDMLYLMSLAGYQPIIEYCGGTEISGAYVTSTVVENNYPSLFSTPAMGLDFLILDEHGKATSEGEVAIIPPSIGLSTRLLNADHEHIYFDGMPNIDHQPLRRHGDEIRRLPNGYYLLLGRVDDAMNLGGIKISAAEIERTLMGIPDITETAAISITPKEGPALLVIFAATTLPLEKPFILKTMQARINQFLNPLFKIHDVVFVKELPKTASNKIMRRSLRKQYQERV